MNKYIIIACLLMIFTISSCEKKNAASKVKTENLEKAKERDAKLESLPIATFDKTEFDFGTINQGDVVETSYKITNTGKTDLIISQAKGSCGCTVPTWPKAPIKPGASGTIDVKFNSKNKTNKQKKTVTLYTNTAEGRHVLFVKGMVTPKSN